MKTYKAYSGANSVDHGRNGSRHSLYRPGPPSCCRSAFPSRCVAVALFLSALLLCPLLPVQTCDVPGNLIVPGKVGIGTTSPLASLHLYKDANAIQSIYVQNPNAGSGAYTTYQIDTAGNVVTLYSFGSAFSSPSSQYSPSGGTLETAGSGGLSLSSNHAAGLIKFFTAGANERMRIDSTGNVGIGTANPETPLEVSRDSDGAIVRFIRRAVAAWDFGVSHTPTAAGLQSGSFEILPQNGNTDFSIGSQVVTAALVVKNSGNVGIGTTTPGYKLHVNGSFAATSKNFEIDHPKKAGVKLVHSTLEGPEIAVFYRGEAQLVDGEVTLALPEYFEALTREDGRTVLLTPKFSSKREPISVLAASSVEAGSFMVRAVDQNNPDQRFYWEVKAVRKDVAPLVVEKEAEKPIAGAQISGLATANTAN